MNVSYEGIGQWAATFICEGIREGEMVKVTGNGTAGPCEAGDRFCGTVLFAGRDGACTVALGGMVTARYSGGAPSAGWCGLVADGSGGVSVGEGGGSYLVVDTDDGAGTVTFVL